MMTKKLKLLLASITLAVLGSAGVVYADLITSLDLEFTRKVINVCYNYNVWTPVTETDLGSDGLVGYKSVDTGGTNNLTFVAADMANLAYPARLGVVLADITANDTLTCTSVTITGVDQFGKQVSETVTTVSETAKNTNAVFRKITGITAVACSDGTDAGDSLAIYLSSFVGLGTKIKAKSDVEAACVKVAAGTSYDCTTDATAAAAITLYNQTTPAASYTFDASTNAFDGAAGVDDQVLCMRIVPSFK